MTNNGTHHVQTPRLTKASAAEFSSSASEDEDDYRIPGLRDEEDFGDFGPRKRRRTGRHNKEKAALGIFGSDSENDGPGSRWKRKTLRNKGMTFVATATRSSDPGNDQDQEERSGLDIENENDGSDGHEEDGEDGEGDEDDERNTPPAGVGLGFRPAPTPVFESPKHGDEDIAETITATRVKKSKFNGESVLGMGFVPSSAREPVLREPLEGQEQPQNKPQPSTFTTKGKVNAKGFGARMMAKMGYVEGTGLGKESQGRNIIIEANLRPQGIGLGAVKEKSEQERSEEKRQAMLRGEKVVDSDEEDKLRKKSRKKTLARAAGSGSSTPRRQRPRYLTAAEFKASAPGLSIPEAFTPILDMTKPGSQMITSTSGIMTPTSGGSEAPEEIEARKLAKRAQADLRAFSEEWRSLEEKRAWTDLELREKEQEIQVLRSDSERVRLILHLMTREIMTATDLNQVFICLQKLNEVGASSAEVADVAVAAVYPFLEKADWDPLADPVRFTSELKDLSPLFMKSEREERAVDTWRSNPGKSEGIYRKHAEATTSYETMMLKFWLRKVVSAASEWDSLSPSPMLDLIEGWDDLLPAFVRAQVLALVVRKLREAVENWKPKKKDANQSPPHLWLFPWLQHLPAYHLDPKGTGLVSDVRRKFREWIDAWEFERGTVPKLKQWEVVFGSHWRPMVMSHILPAMGRYLRSHFRVDPADQEPYLPILTGIMKWNRILGDTMIEEVLVQNVFPMWHAKLQEWLALRDADLQEVADWYTWWRSVLLKDMVGARVKAELDKGMQFMNVV